jgi:hypothetical protein
MSAAAAREAQHYCQKSWHEQITISTGDPDPRESGEGGARSF